VNMWIFLTHHGVYACVTTILCGVPTKMVRCAARALLRRAGGEADGGARERTDECLLDAQVLEVHGFRRGQGRCNGKSHGLVQDLTELMAGMHDGVPLTFCFGGRGAVRALCSCAWLTSNGAPLLEWRTVWVEPRARAKCQPHKSVMATPDFAKRRRSVEMDSPTTVCGSPSIPEMNAPARPSIVKPPAT
jgi:hypothetical protein